MTPRRPVTTPPRTVPVGQLRRNLAAVQRFRLNVVGGALLILFLGLLVRLGTLQLVEASAWSARAARRHDVTRTFQGLAGRILDRHGRTLVSSRRVLSVAVDPQVVRDPLRGSPPLVFARRVAALLDDASLAPRIYRQIVEAPAGCRHRGIAPFIDDERVVTQLAGLTTYAQTASAGLAGLKVENREVRHYPNEYYAAHVLGRAPYQGEDGLTGGSGVECAFREVIGGETLEVAVQRDGGRGRRCRTCLAVDPLETKGRDLVLTLDIVIQHHLETALDRLEADWEPEFASGVVLDPQTGDVLALSSRPGFDPEREGSTLNYAVQGLSPPGSIFKPFAVAWALGDGVVAPGERVELPRARPFHWSGHTRVVHDSHDSADFDGRGTPQRVIHESSNTGVALYAWRIMGRGQDDGVLSVAPFRQHLEDLGLEGPTGIELCGDLPVRYARAKRLWNPLYPVVGLAFGQGLQMSPLRLACCFAAFARDDARVLRPSLLPGCGGPRLDLPRVCASPEHLAIVREGLAMCVDEGTGRRAFAGCPYPASGKTGTAEQPRGPSLQPWNFAGFCGFAPRERPSVLVLVVAKVDSGRNHPTTDVRPYGGAVSGPAARYVIERSLDYLRGAQGDPGPGEEAR